MKTSNTLHPISRLAVIFLCAWGSMEVTSARAELTISGQYNQTDYGYTVSGDTFIVTPTAEFNSDTYYGFSCNSGSSGTIQGGQYENDGQGMILFEGAVVTVGGVIVTGNRIGMAVAYGGNVTINSGTIGYNSTGVVADDGSVVSIYGGAFTRNGIDFRTTEGTGEFDLYGSFNGLTPGQTVTMTGIGSFVGTLLNETQSQTFTYGFDNGTGGEPATVVLHAVPEPATDALVLAGGSGVVALLLRRRRCQQRAA